MKNSKMSFVFFMGILFFYGMKCHAQGRSTKPNVILIVTDEHNFRTIGVHRAQLSADQALMWGNTVVETPNIDRIGNEGAILTSMYVTTPVCTPSRASMFTGKYPQELGITSNAVGIKTSDQTFAEIFRNDGYKTGYIGKWHLSQDNANQFKPGWMLEPDLKNKDYGFDHKNYMFNRGHWKKFETIPNPNEDPNDPTDDTLGEESTSVTGATSTSFATDWLTDRAIEFIDDNAANPFLCVISYPDPHTANKVRAPYDTMYTGNTINLPSTHRTGGILNEDLGIFAEANWTNAETDNNTATESRVLTTVPQYFGMVKCLDDNIKKVLDKLTAEGILDNTIIVFTSDHGDSLGEHGRENKGEVYETSAGVAFLIRYPALITAPRVVNTAVNNADIMDTLISMAGITGFDDTTTTGKDITAIITGTETQPTINGITLNGITFSSLGGWGAAISDRFKLVMESSTGSTKKMPWLIDLEADATETVNFIDPNTGKAKTGYKAIAKTLAEKLKAYGAEVNDTSVTNSNVQEQLNVLINDAIDTDVSILSTSQFKTDFSMRIHPNPAKRHIKIDLGSVYSEKSSVSIYDSNGCLVKNIKNANSLLTIDISKLAKGVYFLKVEGDENTIKSSSEFIIN